MTTTITVSTAAELISALATATGGETILMASGNYGDLTLINGKAASLDFLSTVTITAADLANPPVITGLDLRGASNLTFDSITFDYTFSAGDSISTKPFYVSGSENITFSNSTFDGDVASGLSEVDNGYGAGFGLNITGSVGVNVVDSEFYGFYRALVIGKSEDILVSGNDIHSIRMDGMNFAAVQNIVIEENYIHDFIRSLDSADHSDMIQFWTAGTTTPSTDIVIRNNILSIGEGDNTQSIFIRNELVDKGLAGEEMYYQNVTIEGNLITNAHAHGITVGETDGLTISNNSVLHYDGAAKDGADSSVEIPRILVASASTNVSITQNITSSLSGYTNQSDWTVTDNAYVQDQDSTAAGWYGDVFISSTLGTSTLIALPGGVIDTLQAGAPATLGQGGGSSSAVFHASSVAGVNATMLFDAGVVDQPEGTTYLWDFGDGMTASGASVTHQYAGSGEYSATLTTTLPDGSISATSVQLKVPSSTLVELGQNMLGRSDSDADTSTSTASLGEGGYIHMGGTGVSASVSTTFLASLYSSKDVSISLTMNADTAGTTGEVLRLSSSFIVSVNSQGALQFRAWSSEGDVVSLLSKGIKVNDGASHDIDLRLTDGLLSLWVDDVEVGSTAFSGSFATSKSDLTVGNPWHSSFFTGELTEFSIELHDVAPTVDVWGMLNSSNGAEAEARQADSATSATTVENIDDVILIDDSAPETSVTDDSMADASRMETDSAASSDNNAVISASENSTDSAYSLESPEDRSLILIQDGQSTVAATATAVDAVDLSPLYNSEDVGISMTLDAEIEGTTGDVLCLWKSFIVSVNSQGELQLRAWSSEGDYVSVTSDGIKVNDGTSHDIDIQLAGGQLALWIDQTLISSNAFEGSFAEPELGELWVDNPWHDRFFEGDLIALSIDTGIDHMGSDPFSTLALDASPPLA